MDLGVGRQLSFHTARRLLVLTGLVVLAATAAVLYVRRVEDVEVVAVLLFIPIYLAVVTGKIGGGVIAAVIASIVYAVLRLGGVDAFDTAQQVQLVISRALAYLTFGLVGGFAVSQLEAAVLKLDRYDLIDDDTGLFNARFAGQELELELARSTRYSSSFSVVELEGPLAPFLALRRSGRSAALRALGQAVTDGVRLVDRAAVAQEGDRFRVLVIMPETPATGAEVVVNRLAGQVETSLAEAGADFGGSLTARSLTFPDDRDALTELQAAFAELG